MTMPKQQKDKLNQTAHNADLGKHVELPVSTQAEAKPKQHAVALAKEINGPKGLEPTRYGDWEAKGRCYDF